MPRMIYRCNRKECRKVRAIDYPNVRKLMLGYGRTEYEYSRTTETGRVVKMGMDGVCECGSQCTSNRVRGFVTDHVCDARCTSATGHNCECQCGGKNHGADHMAA